MIFPEGTTTNAQAIIQFKTGARGTKKGGGGSCMCVVPVMLLVRGWVVAGIRANG